MSTQAESELPVKGATALMAHLRENPDDTRLPPDELAGRFGLSAAFVESVLSQTAPPEHHESHKSHVSLSDARHAVRLVWSAVDRTAANPIQAIWVSSLVALLISIALAVTASRNGSGAFSMMGGELAIRSAGVTFVVIATAAFHMLVYFRRGMTRFALYGALVVWLFLSLPLMMVVWQHASGEPDARRAGLSLLVALALFVVALVYAGLGSLFSVFGGYARLLGAERKDERMSRQELLERYFELESRLERGSFAERDTWEDWDVIRSVRHRPYVWAFALGATWSLMHVALSTAYGVPIGPAPGVHRPVTFLILSMAVFVANGASFLMLTFLSGNVRSALLATLTFVAGNLLATALPIGKFGLVYLTNPRVAVPMIVTVVFFLMIGSVVGVGAEVQRRAFRDLSLQRNDQAAILGEMLRIQWRLSDAASKVCVLVVDAAKSSEMKAAADPLAVEYSFREYQEWIAEISRPLEGRVHSTAGDGAVVAFPDCARAYAAARRVQTDIDRFNQHVNRLRSPFRLRVGLHVGEVQGDLDKVQFTEVIDIAAHVQGVAPVAGIAVSDSVIAELGEEGFVPLAKTVDDHQVYLALDPVDD